MKVIPDIRRVVCTKLDIYVFIVLDWCYLPLMEDHSVALLFTLR
jgi:hypothetical protein